VAQLPEELDKADKRLNQGKGQDYTIVDTDQDIIRVFFESPFRAKWLRIARKLINDSAACKLTGGCIGRDVPWSRSGAVHDRRK
jgi:hypothetical protein